MENRTQCMHERTAMQKKVSREETPKRLSQHPLQRERAIRNWSQQDLADKLGTTFGNVSRWERRITSPSAYYRQKLCDLFGKDVASEVDVVRFLGTGTVPSLF